MVLCYAKGFVLNQYHCSMVAVQFCRAEKPTQSELFDEILVETLAKVRLSTYCCLHTFFFHLLEVRFTRIHQFPNCL